MKIRNNVLVKVDNEDIIDGKFVVPSFVTEIGKNCFSNCTTSLEELIMHDGVETIDEYAFNSCVMLNKIKFSKNLKSIYQYAFANCHSIKEIILPENLTTLANGVFDNCINLKSVKLPKDLTVIESFLFNQCINLKNIIIPNKVLKIENSAFSSCVSIEEIDLPSSVRIINKYAFSQCTALKKINMGNGIFRIDDYAFYCCIELVDCKLPKTLLTIGNHAFESCSKITEFELPDNIEFVGEGAFTNCSYLKKINIPKNITQLGNSIFSGCLGLFEIDIPDSIEIIKENAFNDSYILELYLPNSIKIIDNFAFANNRLLTHVELSRNLEILGESVFENCPSIERLKIYDKFKCIAYNAIGVNNDIKYIIKDKDAFIFTKSLQKNDCDYIKLDEKSNEIKELLIAFWDRKEKILNDIKNENIFYLYKTLYSFLWKDKEKFEEFLDCSNFTFFNTLNLSNINDLDKKQFLKFYYNLGGFLPKNSYKKKSKGGLIKEKMLNYSQIVTEFLKEMIVKNKFDLNNACKMFFNMNLNGFNQDFTIFFIENFDKLISEERANPGFINKCYNQFDEVQATNTTNKGEQRQLKATFEKFKDYFNSNKFVGVVNENLRLIANMLSPYYSKQSIFDTAVEIDNERKAKSVPNSILSFHLEEEKSEEYSQEHKEDKIDYTHLIKFISNTNYQNELSKGRVEFSYEWLDRNNPINFIISKIIQKGCAHLDGVGYGIMRASIVDENVQNLAIKTKVILDNGNLLDLGYIAKATFYINRNERYGVFNTIKIRDVELNRTLQEQLYQTLIKGIHDFISYYNKENPNFTIKEISIGKNSNDLLDIFQQHCIKRYGDDILRPIDFAKYGSDRLNYFGDALEEQFVLYDVEKNKL